LTREVALLLTVFTGFSGLSYEVAWEKYLATLLGCHGEATAAVLALFLGGLALGYALFGSVTRHLVTRGEATGRAPRLLLFYGLIEAGIGAWVLLFPWLFESVRRLSLHVPQTLAGFAFDVVLSALLIGPPAVLMGATIPVLTQALARSLSDATRFHAFVYGCNTAGAFLGALAAGFVLIPRLGLPGVMRAMGCVNLAVGGLYLVLGLRQRAVLGVAEEATSRPPGFAACAAAALLLGFAMMAVQTVLIRLGALSFGASQFTFSMVVAVFVSCIALGSLAVSALPRISPLWLPASVWGLALLLLALYPRLEEASYWVHVLRSVFRDEAAAFYPYHLAALLGLLLVLGPPLVLSGASLPLIFHDLRRVMDDLGANAGRLYGWNTLGSLLGALLGGYALLFWLELNHVYRIAVAAVTVAALLLSLRRGAPPRLRWAALLAGPLGVVLALLPAWDPALLAVGLYRNRAPQPFTYRGPDALLTALEGWRPIYHDDDPTASVSVTEILLEKGKYARSILTNGKSDSSTKHDYPTMALAALLPALFAERPERAFVIGLGTGVTAGELAALEEVREVVVAEISPAVVRAAPLFDFANLGVSRNPEVRIVRSDAYRALQRSEERFDVVVSEPSNPWISGIEMLFSREFLLAARGRLRPGGVYAQWFHEYETSPEAMALVLRTYASVFEHVALWYTRPHDLVVLAFADASKALDLSRLERRAARPDFAAGLTRAGVESFPELLAHELLPLGVIHAARLEGPLHTLYHPRLGYEAALGFFRGQTSQLPFMGGGEARQVGIDHSLIGRYAARFGGVLPIEERARIVSEACTVRVPVCATLLAKWLAEEPGDPAVQQDLARLSTRLVETGRVTPAVLSRLESFFGDGRAEADERVSPKEARERQSLFVEFYHPAAPFEPQPLLDAWRRCRARNPRQIDACRAGLRHATALLAGATIPTREATVPDGDFAAARVPHRGRRTPQRLPTALPSGAAPARPSPSSTDRYGWSRRRSLLGRNEPRTDRALSRRAVRASALGPGVEQGPIET
jgi:spermidine synthase